jgi:hypothetical protein
MFFKPFAAYDKRIRKADGSAENLPTLNRDEPSDGQISTQCPQPSQRVIYTKVGILFLLSFKLVYKISNGLAFHA